MYLRGGFLRKIIRSFETWFSTDKVKLKHRKSKFYASGLEATKNGPSLVIDEFAFAEVSILSTVNEL
jgi:hypothetical protein